MIRVDFGPISEIVYIDIMLNTITRLVIGTSRTVGSAKKFVRITSVLVEESSRRHFVRYVHV